MAVDGPASGVAIINLVGITTTILRVREHRKSVKFADVEFLVDSGAVYSVVPGKVLDTLYIEPYRE